MWRNAQLAQEYQDRVDVDEEAFRQLEAQSQLMRKDIEDQQAKIAALNKDNECIKQMVDCKDQEIASYESNLEALKNEFAQIKDIIHDREQAITALRTQLEEVKSQCVQYKQKYDEICQNASLAAAAKNQDGKKELGFFGTRPERQRAVVDGGKPLGDKENTVGEGGKRKGRKRRSKKRAGNDRKYSNMHEEAAEPTARRIY